MYSSSKYICMCSTVYHIMLCICSWDRVGSLSGLVASDARAISGRLALFFRPAAVGSKVMTSALSGLGIIIHHSGFYYLSLVLLIVNRVGRLPRHCPNPNLGLSRDRAMDSAAGNAVIDRRGKDPVVGNPSMMIPYTHIQPYIHTTIHTFNHTYYAYIHTCIHTIYTCMRYWYINSYFT